MDKVERIIIHCSDTLPSRNTTVSDLWRMHVKENGWSHIGYHYYIKTDGRIFACRPEHMQGAGVKFHNANAIQVCYEGGAQMDAISPAFYCDTRTPAQRHALFLLLLQLLERFPAVEDICGHRDLATGKACPCFDARTEYSWLIEYREEIQACHPLIIPFSWESIKEVDR